MKRMILALAAVAALAIGIGAVSLSAEDTHNFGDCYYLMIDYCNQQAGNSPEGGYDVAYDTCVSWWYGNAKCAVETQYPTVVGNGAISTPPPAIPKRRRSK